MSRHSSVENRLQDPSVLLAQFGVGVVADDARLPGMHAALDTVDDGDTIERDADGGDQARRGTVAHLRAGIGRIMDIKRSDGTDVSALEAKFSTALNVAASTGSIVGTMTALRELVSFGIAHLEPKAQEVIGATLVSIVGATLAATAASRVLNGTWTKRGVAADAVITLILVGGAIDAKFRGQNVDSHGTERYQSDLASFGPNASRAAFYAAGRLLPETFWRRTANLNTPGMATEVGLLLLDIGLYTANQTIVNFLQVVAPSASGSHLATAGASFSQAIGPAVLEGLENLLGEVVHSIAFPHVAALFTGVKGGGARSEAEAAGPQGVLDQVVKRLNDAWNVKITASFGMPVKKVPQLDGAGAPVLDREGRPVTETRTLKWKELMTKLASDLAGTVTSRTAALMVLYLFAPPLNRQTTAEGTSSREPSDWNGHAAAACLFAAAVFLTSMRNALKASGAATTPAAASAPPGGDAAGTPVVPTIVAEDEAVPGDDEAVGQDDGDINLRSIVGGTGAPGSSGVERYRPYQPPGDED